MSVLWLLAGLALAQGEETFDETVKEAEVVAKPVGEASAESGGSLVTGNSEFYQITAKLSGGYKWGNNRISALGDALWGKGYVDVDGSGTLEDAERAGQRVETARRVALDARYDRFFGEKNSVYVLAGALVDPFAGYDLRTHEQIGYSRTAVDNKKTALIFEIGADYAQENYVDGVDPNYRDIIAAREMVALKHAFSDSVSIEEIAESFQNVLDLEDVRFLNTFTLSTKLSDKLSLKASHQLRFDNQPVEGFRPTDQTALLTLVATLFKSPEPPPPPAPPPCDCGEEAAADETPVEPPAEESPAEPAPDEETPEGDGGTGGSEDGAKKATRPGPEAPVEDAPPPE